MGTFTLNVQIDPKDFKTLKDANYNLCLAKKCNDLYTVVWSGSNQYLQNNKFQWTDEYQVFGINKFKAGAPFRITTVPHPIDSGQVCEMNKAGELSGAQGAVDTSGKFSVVNNYGKVGFGVSCKFGDVFLPFFVTPTAVVGTAFFEPVVIVRVWFSVKQRTGTMIPGADEEGVQVKYLGKTAVQSVAYVGGKWVISQ